MFDLDNAFDAEDWREIDAEERKAQRERYRAWIAERRKARAKRVARYRQSLRQSLRKGGRKYGTRA
jgi:hypothetical protein